LNLEFLLIVAAALGLGGFIKGATGMGLPLVSVPALAAFLGVPHALAILTVPLIITNAWQAWRFFPHRGGTGFLKRLLPAGAVGIGLGTWALANLRVETLSLALALLILIYIGLHLTRPNLRIPGRIAPALSPGVGLVAGLLQGSTGISAPVSITFLHALRLTPQAFVFAVSALFLLFASVQLVTLALAGIMTWRRFLEGLIALLPIVLAMPIGAWASSLLSRRAFDRIILLLLAAMALKLFFESF
jgi:uncharacterized protein